MGGISRWLYRLLRLLRADLFDLDPEWGVLGSDDPEHLSKVRRLLEKYHMYAEFATRGLGYDHLLRVVRAADAVGADIIRTYIPITLNAAKDRETGGDGKYDLGKIRLDFDPAVFEEAVASLKAIVPVLRQYRVRIALENHEYETADELVEVIKKVDSPWIGLHYDFGNAMMAWEDPVEAAKKMAPYTFTTHFKDHIVIPCPEDKYGYVVCGVPAGEGNIDLAECLRVMLDGSTLQRLNIEMCYPYCAQFKRTPGAGASARWGKGASRWKAPSTPRRSLPPASITTPRRSPRSCWRSCWSSRRRAPSEASPTPASCAGNTGKKRSDAHSVKIESGMGLSEIRTAPFRHSQKPLLRKLLCVLGGEYGTDRKIAGDL